MFDALRRFLGFSVENRAIVTQIRPGDSGTRVKSFLTGLRGGEETNAGATVDVESALGCSAFYAGVSVLSNAVAQLPIFVYERTDNGKLVNREHPVYSLLHRQPNYMVNPFEFKAAIMNALILEGNYFGEIERNNLGEPIGLWRVPTDLVEIVIKDNILTYWIRTTQGPMPVAPENMLHIKGFSRDGIVGESVIHYARQSLGLTISAEKFGARWFGSGSRPGGYLTHPTTLSEEAGEKLMAGLRDTAGGVDKSHSILLLEEGMKFESAATPPEDAQFLETRQHQITEVARWLNIPPHLIADLSKATFSNIEHQGLNFLRFSLQPWLIRIEEELTLKLLPENMFAEFNADAIGRADTKSRYEAYQVGRQAGFLSINDIRERENMALVPDGDDLLVPLNMIAVGSEEVVGEEEVTPEVVEDVEDEEESRSEDMAKFELLVADMNFRLDTKAYRDFEPLVTSAFERCNRRAEQKQSKNTFELDEHITWCRSILAPISQVMFGNEDSLVEQYKKELDNNNPNEGANDE